MQLMKRVGIEFDKPLSQYRDYELALSGRFVVRKTKLGWEAYRPRKASFTEMQRLPDWQSAIRWMLSDSAGGKR